MNKNKTQEGITLIALVITIIVMLILVGVTVSIAINGGLFSTAKEATRQTQIQAIREQVQVDLAVQSATNSTVMTRDLLKNILDKYFTDVPDTLPKNLTEVTLTAKEEYGGIKNVLLTDIYDVITKEEISENAKTYFGKEVNGYECEEDGVEAWKIFYADESNVYLISNYYISYIDAPEARDESKVNHRENDYSIYFKDIVESTKDNVYKGSEDITNEKIQELNSDYFKKYTDTNVSAKAVAYLLDTDAWKVYAEDGIAEYAIGSPTIELFFKSYNKKYGTNYQTQANEDTKANGYQISEDGGISWDGHIKEMINSSDLLYCADSYKDSTHLWIASPAYQVYRGLPTAYSGGAFGGNNCDEDKGNTCGIRPVVCLSSDVQFVMEANGTLTIIK